MYCLKVLQSLSRIFTGHKWMHFNASPNLFGIIVVFLSVCLFVLVSIHFCWFFSYTVLPILVKSQELKFISSNLL